MNVVVRQSVSIFQLLASKNVFADQEESLILDLGLYTLYYWAGQNVSLVFFYKIKDTFFIFTNNFIDLDILSMLAISGVV